MKKYCLLFVWGLTLPMLLANAPFALAQEDVRITEFMASNGSTLQDEDHEYPDWIEIFNASTNVVNLLNWSLTDSAGNLSKWQFPATNIAPSQFLIVFASGKDRRTPGLPLHTSFKLSAVSGYLALVRPDSSIATEFGPTYPAQFSDVSYGFSITQSVFTVLATNATLRALVPADGSLGDTWTSVAFDDSGWISGTNGAGYDTAALNPEDSAATSILNSGPAAYWRLNESSGAVAVNIGNNHINGSYQSVTLAAAGPRPTAFGGFEANNGAAQFNGTSSSIGTGSNFMNNLSAFSLAGWVRPTAFQSARAGLFGQNGAVGLGFIDAITIQVFTAGGGSLNVNYGFPLSEWHHVAAVGDGASLKIYFDGVLQDSGGSVTGNYGASAAPFNIGGGGIFDASGNFFTGQIDEVAVWSRALAPAEIQQQFQTATNGIVLGGYTNLIRTDLRAAMFGVNSSAYIRYPFTLADPSQVDKLTLRIQYDDAFVAYLNGVVVAWRNVPDDVMFNPLAFNDVASNYHPDGAALQLENVDISIHIGALLPGANMLAIQGLNTSATNSDFLIRAALEGTTIGTLSSEAGYFKKPTPGAANGLSTTDIGPVISKVGNTPAPPAQPTIGDSITVTAKVVKSFFTVTNVVLNWRVMFGPTNQLQMLDDGLHGDGAAGDGIYGATIPAGVATNGEMLRWIVWASDSGGRLSRWPLFEVPSDSAEYEGTVIFDPNLTSKLPIFQIFINPNSTNWIKPFPSGLPNVGVDSQTGGRMSLFYNGDLYDNIDMAVRGNTTAGYPKNSHHVNFHPDKPLKHPGPGGAIFHTSFLSETADPAFLRTYLSFWLLDLMGVPSPFDYPVRFQLNSQYYGLYFHNDTLGPEQLKRLGYDPSGALYKAAGQIVPSYASTGGFEKRTRLYEGRQDYDALAYGINEARPAGVRKTNIFDMLNLPEIVNYLAVARWNCEGDDVWANMTLYRDTENTREWFIIPFDLNVSWGQLYCGDVSSAFGSVIATNDNYKSHPFYGGSQVQQNHSANWNRIYDVIVATPETRQMLQRRERTLMDKFVQPPGTTVVQGIMEQQIVYMTNLMWTEMFLDRQKWQWPCSSVCGMYCWGPGGNTGTLPAPWPTNTDFGAPGLINEYIVPRRTHWFVTHSITNTARSIGLDNTNNAGLPLAQPANAFITVAGLEANPASGIQAQEYICLTNPTPFALDISGWKLNGAVDFTFKPGTVMPSNSVLYVSPDVAAFRARGTGPSGGQGLFVVGPYKGQLSARGETISITDDTGRSVSSYSYPDASSAVQQFLRITELMYHPEPLSGNPNGPEEFEYIELKNISTNVTLDLTGVRLINGVDFNFTGSAVTSLASGQRVLIVKNLAAFTARYGSLPNVAGQYGGYLDNGGERIQLVDAKGEEVLDFSYNNSWYPITDGLGFSLVVVDEQAMPDAWDSKVNWRASGAVSGSPGGVDPAPPAFSPVVINEALPRTDLPPPTDSIELFNPSASSADISGWFLSNDFFTPKKYRLPAGTILAAGTYRVFDESQFNPQPGVDPSFSLNGLGGAVYLFSANAGGDLTGYYHGFSFGAAENGVSFGRYVSSDGKEQFVGQAALSLGTNNPPPKVGPVVINEIMYHPPEIGGTNDNTVDEFLELLNISNSTVSLFDGAQPWKIAGGIDFALPLGVTLASGQTLLVVNFNPTNALMLAAFQAKYGVGAGVQVFGPYDGKLNNNGDEVRLIKPTTQLGGTIPFVLVDRVEYSDSAPWPAGADGFGLSLQRKTATAFGNDPANWLAALPSAAAATSASGTAPAITAQSPSQAAVAGTNLILSVSATGDTPRHYQWRYNGADLTDATNATLQLSGIQQQNAGDYKVVVFNNAGSAVSSNMTISILLPASILVHPQGVTAFPLSSASFNVLAFSTTPLRYQWRFNGTDIQAATNATFTIASVQPANDGQYSVAVTDAVGTGVSDAAHLTVLLHPVFTQQPTNRTIFLGTNATNITFSAASSSTTPVTYQWHFNGATVPGVTGGSFTISNAQVQAGGDFPVSVVATDTYGSIESTNATLRVILIPILTQQPQSQIVALGSTVTFSATASGTPPFSFRWRRNNAFVPGASYLTNSNTGLFTTNNVTTNSIYAVAITNLAGNTLGGPVLGLSSNAYLYVMAPPVDQTVNEGADATFTTAPQGLVPSINYQWKFNGGDLANATSASLTLTNVQAIAEGDYSVVVTISTNAPVPPATFTAKLHVISTRPRLTNPQVNPDRSFRGVLQAQLNQSYIVEISTNLANWTTLTNFLATNVSMPFIDVTATNAHQRFYRARTVSP